MTDRELLGQAAKAAGIAVVRARLHDPACQDFLIRGSVRNPYQDLGPWNPLADDGDALRLAVKLFMFVDSAAGAPNSFGAELVRAGNEVVDKTEPRTHDDPYAAARRAIVRAAAEIGKQIKGGQHGTE